MYRNQRGGDIFMAPNYNKILMKDYDKLIYEKEKLEDIIKEQRAEIKILNKNVDDLKDIIGKQNEQINSLFLEIERLKNNNDKDSTNSSKPSSKNGFKEVKNSREKTDRKPGGQKGHKGHTSKASKVKKLIESGKVKHNVFEINKTKKNKNKAFRTRYIQDIEILTTINEYHYYPNEKGSYEIPKKQSNIVTYGSTVKAISGLLVHRAPVSMDQTVNFLNAITSGNFDISKASLSNWSNTLSGNLDSLMFEIEQGLYNSYLVNTDESPVNVNGKTKQLHNYSNEKYTLQVLHDKKSKAAIEEINFLPNYMGILIHDHNKVQYNYGTRHGECNAHILRYIKAVSDFTSHKWPSKMTDCLKEILHNKHLLKDDNILSFDKSVLKKYSQKYDDILKTATKEYQSDCQKNAYKDHERRLITRLKKYKENHLLFMYDFKIPFTNNRAESDIRPVKRKLNVGIFRSQNGANVYLQIRNFISTFLKNNYDIFEAMKNAFDNKEISLNQG